MTHAPIPDRPARRRSRAALALLALVALSPARALHAQATPAAQDVFDELQQNVWYLPTPDSAARLYVTSLGRGPTVVVLHGGPGNDFHYLVGALRPLAARYRFVLFDQRGSLLSPVAPGEVGKISLDVLVDDLEALRRALGESEIVLFGHSFGTVLAQAYYRRYPERVAGMVLAASGPPRADAARPFMSYIREARERMSALRARPEVEAELRRAGIAPEAGAALSARQRSERSRIRMAALNLARVERWRQMHGGGVYYSAGVDDAVGATIPDTFDLAPALARHAAPVTVVQGDRDYLDPAAASWRPLADSGDAVRIEVLRDAGHYAWIDDPDGFARALAAGLGRTRR